MTKTMTKNDLINALAERNDTTLADAKAAIEGVFDIIEAAMKNGDEVRMRGFGTFKMVERKARVGRNPRTGAEIDIPVRMAPKVVFSRSF